MCKRNAVVWLSVNDNDVAATAAIPASLPKIDQLIPHKQRANKF